MTAATSPLRRSTAQARWEASLLLRNGEQLLLTLIIPAVNLVGIAVMVLLVTVAFPTPSVFTAVPLWLSAVVAPCGTR